MLQHVRWPPHSNTSWFVLCHFINRLQLMVGSVANTCIQESIRPLTTANRPWICSSWRRGTEFIHLSFLNPLSFAWLILLTPIAATRWSRTCNQQRGAIQLPCHSPWCALLQGISNNEKSDNGCSARPAPAGFQMKTDFSKCCPSNPNQEMEDDYKKDHQENCPIFPDSIRYQLQPGNFPSLKLFPYIHILWLTAIAFSG